ncbi:enoyl-CoA hydratase/isomerase family protein [Salipiger bermudensis]|uniref:3-hydroxyacyl-CoA dehydrogenase NAD-binding domain-containing protein n=1 Tax=Salipiger bermudensis TaxID=344736 RepID=UPI001C99A08F|nr:3-hydroxyacyl-CoA dehydrogenase NAD-binding domain-containing protein [Salipiger bermudensis]MBY6005021.1 enoyl-CoA hydratase/isomerase family protein [Salipiger bermudensis]
MPATLTASPVRTELRGRALLVTIDNPPLNVIGQTVRAGLLAACTKAEMLLETGAIDRVIVTGAGRAFVAGADVREFDGPALDPQLPEVLGRLEALPSVAAINGTALGGGLEIALACRVRLAAPGALMGLPEVTLGIVPGSGGTQRLPRIIGLEAALPLASTGARIGAEEALSLGMVDGLSERPLEAALALAPERLDTSSAADLPRPAPAPEAAEAARATARKKMRGQIAPLRAIALVEASAELPFDAALAEERATFLELRAGSQASALRHVFFAERAAARPATLQAEAPAEIRTALVAGGGTMGAAIAYALCIAGIDISLLEHDAAAAARARANVAGLFEQAVARGKLAQDAADRQLSQRFRVLHGPQPLPPVDIAIEAVFEDLAVKQALFRRFAADLPPTTLLATNTSYLDPDAIAGDLARPERFLGLHFFAPAHLMKLVEIVRARASSPQTLATAFGLTRRLGKVAVEAGICEGFIGNRILSRYRQACEVMLLEGALPWEIDDAMTGFGMAMGPFMTQDLSGLDIAHANRQRKDLRNQPGIRYVAIADRLVEDHARLGRKTGAGWYDYEDGRPRPSETVRSVIESCATDAGVTRRAFDAEEISRRVTLAMIAESCDILEEGIARRPEEIDLTLIHGYGFPRWRGGPMKLAEDWGLTALRDDLAGLAEEDPVSWSVPARLSRAIAEGSPMG